MNTRKWVVKVLLLVLTVTLVAGCSNNNTNTTTNTKTNNTVDQGGEVNNEPITYSFGTGSNKQKWDTPITQALTAATGVSLTYDVIVGDIFQKWDIWRASGDYPDIIRLDALNLQKYIEAEAVIPLEDLIEQYGPNIKEKFGDKFEMLRHEDGHIYSIFPVNLSEEAPADSAAPYVVQMAVLEDAGYPEIKTLNQLHELIASYKAKNPKIDGQDTIGYTAGMESFMINHSFNNAAIYSDGRPDHGNFYLDGDNVNWNPVSDMSKSLYEFVFGLIQDGLFDIEAFSMDLEAMQAKMAQGRVLSAYAPTWMVGSVNAALRAEGKESQMYAHLPILFNESTENNSVALTPANPGTHEWAITTNAKNPERVIQFIDYLFSDEGQILTNWGIEGTHYEVADGKRTVLDSWLKDKAADADALYNQGFQTESAAKGYWFSIGHGAKLSDGDYATPLTNDLVRREYTETTKKTLDAYGIQTWADLLPEVQFVPGYVWQMQPPESARVIGQKLDEEWRKSLPDILLSKSEAEFNTKWVEFVKSAEDAGLQEYNEAFTAEWKKNLGK